MTPKRDENMQCLGGCPGQEDRGDASGDAKNWLGELLDRADKSVCPAKTIISRLFAVVRRQRLKLPPIGEKPLFKNTPKYPVQKGI
jgi:hypothetical protein